MGNGQSKHQIIPIQFVQLHKPNIRIQPLRLHISGLSRKPQVLNSRRLQNVNCKHGRFFSKALTLASCIQIVAPGSSIHTPANPCSEDQIADSFAVCLTDHAGDMLLWIEVRPANGKAGGIDKLLLPRLQAAFHRRIL